MFRSAVLLLAFGALSATAGAATFTAVPTWTDAEALAPDASPGDGTCATGAGTCTLTAALLETEALPGPDEILLGAGIGSHLVDASIPVLGDLTLRLAPSHGASNSTGDFATLPRGAALTVRDGGRLLTDSLSPYRLVAATGGTIVLSGARSYEFGDPALIVAGGAAEIRDTWLTLEAGTSAALVVESGDLVITRSSLVALNCEALRVNGGTVTATRTRFELGNFFWPQQAGGADALLDLIGGRLTLDRCSVQGATACGTGIVAGPGGSLTARHSVIRSIGGGGVDSRGSIELTDCRIAGVMSCDTPGRSGNIVQRRGGVGVTIHGGTARFTRCAVEQNRHSELFMVDVGQWVGSASGAGMQVVAGSVTCTDTRIAGNVADAPDGSSAAGLSVTGGDVVLERCLVSGNAAFDAADLFVAGGSVTLVDSSVVPTGLSRTTDAELRGGATRLLSAAIASAPDAPRASRLVVAPPATLRAADSILRNCDGAVTSEGHLLVEDAAGCALGGDMTGVITGVPAGLGALDASAAMPTLPLLPGSPALDAADPSGNRDDLGGRLVVDARGLPRVLDGDGDGTARGDLGPREECADAADSDGDGRGDACDLCPNAADDGRDADHDGIGDACDAGDSDGDGVPDADDSCPEDADPSQADADGDGTGDACDGCPDVDDDGSDADADWTPDACDICPFHWDPVGERDWDADGVGDPCDNCPYAANPGQADGDGDGTGNACDSCSGSSPDTDHDGACDAVDNCLDVPNSDQRDTDGDGMGNACCDAADTDGDGSGDACDDCPAVTDPDQVDADADGVGDACDACPGAPDLGTDLDADGVDGGCDNCPVVANVAQADTDGDGIGNACDACPAGDTDSDGDAIPDACDDCPLEPNASQADADGDTAGDACDACPSEADDQADSDLDGRGDACDVCPLVPDPSQADADGDGTGDACDASPCPDATDLRVTKDASGIHLAWSPAPGLSSDVYMGDLGNVRDDATRCAPLLCDTTASSAGLPVPTGNATWLVGSRCPGLTRTLGQDSFGRPTPLPSTACP